MGFLGGYVPADLNSYASEETILGGLPEGVMKTEFLLIFKYIIMLYDAYTYYARIQTPHAHTLSDRETGIIFKVTYNYPNNRINKQFNGMIVRCC